MQAPSKNLFIHSWTIKYPKVSKVKPHCGNKVLNSSKRILNKLGQVKSLIRLVYLNKQKKNCFRYTIYWVITTNRAKYIAHRWPRAKIWPLQLIWCHSYPKIAAQNPALQAHSSIFFKLNKVYKLDNDQVDNQTIPGQLEEPAQSQSLTGEADH